MADEDELPGVVVVKLIMTRSDPHSLLIMGATYVLVANAAKGFPGRMPTSSGRLPGICVNICI